RPYRNSDRASRCFSDPVGWVDSSFRYTSTSARPGRSSAIRCVSAERLLSASTRRTASCTQLRSTAAAWSDAALRSRSSMAEHTTTWTPPSDEILQPLDVVTDSIDQTSYRQCAPFGQPLEDESADKRRDGNVEILGHPLDLITDLRGQPDRVHSRRRRPLVSQAFGNRVVARCFGVVDLIADQLLKVTHRRPPPLRDICDALWNSRATR